MTRRTSKKLTDLLTITGTPAGWPARALVKRLLKEAQAQKLVPGGVPLALSVSFVSAAEMTKLNKRYRGKATPTDVLSFEVAESQISGTPLILGDMVICIPVLEGQARAQGHRARHELAVLLIHGFLHLLGYDHERSRGATLLQARAERKLLDAMGFKGTAAGLISRTSSK